jgi:ankyrin repeat protein
MEHIIDAIILDDVTTVMEMLHQGFNPNSCEDEAMVSPLHIAAQHNALGCAKALLRAGADVDAETTDGITPFEVAKLNLFEEMMELLLRGNHPL